MTAKIICVYDNRAKEPIVPQSLSLQEILECLSYLLEASQIIEIRIIKDKES